MKSRPKCSGPSVLASEKTRVAAFPTGMTRVDSKFLLLRKTSHIKSDTPTGVALECHEPKHHPNKAIKVFKISYHNIMNSETNFTLLQMIECKNKSTNLGGLHK